MQPEQPTNPAPQQAQPPTPVTPPVQPIQPVSPQATSPGQVPEAAFKRIRLVAILAIILGIAQIGVGLYYAVSGELLGILNCLFGAIYLGFGIKLRTSAKNVPATLSSLKIIGLVVILNLILALLSGYGAGLLPALILFYATTVYKKLFEANLITSRSPLTAKAKIL